MVVEGGEAEANDDDDEISQKIFYYWSEHLETMFHFNEGISNLLTMVLILHCNTAEISPNFNTIFTFQSIFNIEELDKFHYIQLFY